MEREMIVHVYPYKGAAYKALKEYIKFEKVTELDRQNLWFKDAQGLRHRFIWRKYVEEPYIYIDKVDT